MQRLPSPERKSASDSFVSQHAHATNNARISAALNPSLPDASVAAKTGEEPVAVILDIEGTTTPIAFVHEVLFPYAKENLGAYLDAHWGEERLTGIVARLRTLIQNEIVSGNTEIKPISSGSAEDVIRQEAVEALQWLMAKDKKVEPLKTLQGDIWAAAYESGSIKGQVYEDVVPAFESWRSKGVKIYIYSSGSVAAQRLLFGYSDKGDLNDYFSGNFDTTVGAKIEAESYSKIVSAIANGADIPSSRFVFYTDNVLEAEAAKKAGLAVRVVVRPGNAPLAADIPLRFAVIDTFANEN